MNHMVFSFKNRSYKRYIADGSIGNARHPPKAACTRLAAGSGGAHGVPGRAPTGPGGVAEPLAARSAARGVQKPLGQGHLREREAAQELGEGGDSVEMSREAISDIYFGCFCMNHKVFSSKRGVKQVLGVDSRLLGGYERFPV